MRDHCARPVGRLTSAGQVSTRGSPPGAQRKSLQGGVRLDQRKSLQGEFAWCAAQVLAGGSSF